MFGVGWAEILVILLVALLVLGPARLPEAARSLGKMYAQVQRAILEARQAVNKELAPERKASEKDTEDV